MPESERESMHEERNAANTSATESVVAPPNGDEQDVGADEQVEALLEADAAPAELAPMVEEQEAPDAADTLEQLEPEESAEVLQRMTEASAAEALSHMVPELAATVLLDLEPAEAAQFLERMTPDDAVDLVQALPKKEAADLLARLHPRKAAQIGKLALYDPETAGGMMTTNLLIVRAHRSIGDAIERVKRHTVDESQNDVFCIDEEGRLVGTITMRGLLVSHNEDLVSAHMERDIEFVGPQEDREEVAKLFERYDLLNLAVVDQERRLLGMVTIDDVIDILREEQTEDVLKQVGAGPEEAVYSGIKAKVRGRLPWLTINLGLASVGSIVILGFHDLLELVPVVAVIYPLIANEAGNTGNQSMAVTLRGLVLGEIRHGRTFALLAKEAVFGLVGGLVIGLVVALVLAGLAAAGHQMGIDVLAHFTWKIGVVAGAAMAAAVLGGVMVGVSVPLVLERLGLDPANGSSILVTMFTDALAYFVFLGLVFLSLDWLSPPGV